MTTPITPTEAEGQKITLIPEAVLEIFNEMIAENFQNGVARFNQSEIVSRISARTGVRPNEIFKNHWLDVEKVYTAFGWNVVYDKPGFNESYPATFTFEKKE